MKRNLLLLCLLCAALLSGSCRRAAERAAQKIRIEAVESITPKGLTSAEAVLRIANGTRYKLLLQEAQFTLCYQSSRVLTLRLYDGFEVPKRSVASVPTRWRIRIEDPLALLLVGRDVRAGEAANLFVSYTLAGRGGPASGNRTEEMVPLSDFLRTFGVTLEEIKNYLMP